MQQLVDRDAQGRVIGLLGVSRDITERTRLERELRASKDALQRILDEAREAIARLGAVGWADLQGIHMHIGSQLFELGPYREAIEAIAADV